MLISHQKRFIFIHIPRTGGTSLRQLLMSQIDDCQPIAFQHSGVHTEGEAFFAHYSDYQIVTLVRNPWARIYSWYKLLNRYAPSLNHPVLSFCEFIQELEHQNPSRHAVDRFHCNQLDYIRTDSGRLVADRVLRFENYHMEVTRLCLDLGLSASKLPHLNDVAGLPVHEAYNVKSCLAVARLSSEDIAYFRYPNSPFEP